LALDNWLPAAELLVECVLLVPALDMASSCLQLITWLMQQVNAALKLARDEGRSSEGVQLQQGIYTASCSALLNLGPAVCHCGKQTSDLKQRRQMQWQCCCRRTRVRRNTYSWSATAYCCTTCWVQHGR
jgi:hypothetical protein